MHVKVELKKKKNISLQSTLHMHVMLDLIFMVMNTKHAKPTEVGQEMHLSVNVSEVLHIFYPWSYIT